MKTTEFWSQVIYLAGKYANLQGSHSPADDLGAFLSDEKSVASFSVMAAGAAVLLIDNDLALLGTPQEVRGGFVAALASALGENAVQAFSGGNHRVTVTLRVPFGSPDGGLNEQLTSITFDRGCVEAHVDALRIAVLLKTNWSNTELPRCLP